jgi:hypothetical protein
VLGTRTKWARLAIGSDDQAFAGQSNYFSSLMQVGIRGTSREWARCCVSRGRGHGGIAF